MIGDLPASQICGPIIATIPNQGRQILTPGSRPTLPQGTRLNVDTFTRNVAGVPVFIPAGQPFPQTLTFTGPVPQTANCTAPIPVVGRGAFKVSENESPVPRDRVFATYDYFSNLNAGFRFPGISQTNLNREIIGFEKTFLDKLASIEIRLPVLQVSGDSSIERSDIGDLTFVLKGVLYRAPESKGLVSTGLAVTAPTGSSFLPEGVPDVHPTLLQPFVGWLWGKDFYTQGFTSILIPTDERDVTYLFNDVSMGYYLYRSQCASSAISSVVPTLELHVNTPLDHRGSATMPIPGIDIVDMTAGVWVTMHRKATLGIAGVVPFTGPRAFDFQASVRFNWQF
jgi:hypothetical protein